MSAKLTIGFLGAGKMATALAKGFIHAKLANTEQIIASDPIDAARSAFAKEVGSQVHDLEPRRREICHRAFVGGQTGPDCRRAQGNPRTLH